METFIYGSLTPVIYPDMLSRMEDESYIYSNYRSLIAQKPKGCIRVEFVIGSYPRHFEIEYDLDLFHQRDKAIDYDGEIDLINRLLLKKYLSVKEEN